MSAGTATASATAPASVEGPSQGTTTCRVRNVLQQTVLETRSGWASISSIKLASDGDRLRARGVCKGNFWVSKRLTITGGAARTAVQPGAFSEAYDVKVYRSSFDHNLNLGYHSAFNNYGTAELIRSEVDHNTSFDPFRGGGIYNTGTPLTVKQSIVRYNEPYKHESRPPQPPPRDRGLFADRRTATNRLLSLKPAEHLAPSCSPLGCMTGHADSITGAATDLTIRNGGTSPPPASALKARVWSSSKISSSGGPSSTVTTQSWQPGPRTTQVSQSIRVVMDRTMALATDTASRAGSPLRAGCRCRHLRSKP